CGFEAVSSGLNMIIFASQTIKSGSESIWFECHMIISVPEMIFFAPDMVICGRNKMNSRRMTMSLLPENLALSRNRLLFSGPLTVSISKEVQNANAYHSAGSANCGFQGTHVFLACPDPIAD